MAPGTDCIDDHFEREVLLGCELLFNHDVIDQLYASLHDRYICQG